MTKPRLLMNRLAMNSFWFPDPTAEVHTQKGSKKPQRLLDPKCTSQEALTRKDIRSNPKSHAPNSEESPSPPINYMESEFHTHEQQLHISMLLLMQNITRFRQLESWLLLHRHSFVTKLLCLEKMLLNVLTDCYWKTECPLLVLK